MSDAICPWRKNFANVLGNVLLEGNSIGRSETSSAFQSKKLLDELGVGSTCSGYSVFRKYARPHTASSPANRPC